MTPRSAVFVAVAAAVVAGALLVVPASLGSVNGGAGLRAVVLKGSQVGPGYRLKMRPDSHCVRRCVTLDLCSQHYKSEAARTARLQVDYVKNAKVGLSNEVVRYRPGGTALALDELNHAVANCPRGPVRGTVAGEGRLTWRVHRFAARGLLKGAVAVKLAISGTAGGHRFTSKGVAIYQVRGALLSGIYTGVPAKSSLAPALKLAVHAARASARNLRRGA